MRIENHLVEGIFRRRIRNFYTQHFYDATKKETTILDATLHQIIANMSSFLCLFAVTNAVEHSV